MIALFSNFIKTVFICNLCQNLNANILPSEFLLFNVTIKQKGDYGGQIVSNKPKKSQKFSKFEFNFFNK
jgi:hypothetical protein